MTDFSLQRSRFALHPLALATLAGVSGGAWGQNLSPATAPAPPASVAAASPAASTASAADATMDKQTVYVTANRRREKAKDVAGSVNVLEGYQLEQRGVTSIDEVAGYVPGLQVTGDTPGNKRLSIRGITTGSLQIGASVATYLDEQPVSLSSSVVGGSTFTNDIDPLDIERIEVLKGPQGSLYGASALGGLVKYVTVSPNLKDIEGRAELGWTQGRGDGGATARAAINVPIVKDLFAVRATAYTREEPGYVTDTLRGKTDLDAYRNEGGRVTALLKPNARFDAKLVLDTQSLNTPDAAVPQADAATLQPTYGKYEERHQFAQPAKNHYDRGALTLNDDLGFANLLSVTSYAHIRSDATSDSTAAAKYLDALLPAAYIAAGLPVTPLNPSAAKGHLVVDTKKKVQEFRLTSPSGGTFDWLAGVFFQEEQTAAHTALDFFSGTDLSTPSQVYEDASVRAKLREEAGYLNGTYHFTDSFDIQAGARYTKLRQDYHDDLSLYSYYPSGLQDSGNSAASKETKTTWLVSPRWALTRDDMVYFRAASGYRPGGPNVPDILGHLLPPFTSDSIINYEVGYKGILPSAKLDLTAALFLIDWKNIQVTAIDAAAGSAYYANGGRARSKGFELEAGWHPLQDLRLSASLSAVNARLTQDIPAVGGVSGDSIPFTPKLTAALTGDYSWALGDGQMSVGATMRHQSKREVVFSSQAPDPYVPTIKAPDLPAYNMLDLRASYAVDRWTGSLFVKNALQKVVPITYTGTSAVPNLETGVTGPADVGFTPPRTIGVSIRVDY